MPELSNALYPEKYGVWAGNPKGMKPSFKHCCAEVTVYIGNWPQRYQCKWKRGHGPDQAYCKTHDPAKVEARRAAADARYNEKYNKERVNIHGGAFLKALQEIADGHNDARGLAREVIDRFNAGAK